jgi:molybdate transport system substrate-binding protein
MNDSISSIVRVFAPVAVSTLINEVLDSFASPPDFAIHITFDLNPNIAPRIISGEPFDVGITNPWYVQDLIDAGYVDANSHIPFAHFPLAIGGRGKDSPVQITSCDGIYGLLRDADSIAYTADGTSGRTFLNTMHRLGVLEEISGKLVPMGPGYDMVSPTKSVAAGKVELAIAPLTTIIATPGIEAIAAFPSTLETDIEMSMFLSNTLENRKLSDAVLQFLSDPLLDGGLAAGGLTRFTFD